MATHREIELRPLAFVLAGYAELAQTRYQAWRRKNRREDLPEHFQELLTQVIAFSDPAVSGGAPSSPGLPPGSVEVLGDHDRKPQKGL